MVWKTTALLLNSATAGAVLFATGDVNAFVHLLEKPSTHDAVPALVREWWPKGAALMTPLLASSVAANLLAYRASHDSNFLIAFGCHAGVIVFTLSVMWDAITDLRSDKPKNFDKSLRSFQWMSNFRTAAVLAALGVTGFAVCPRYHPGARP